MNDTTTELGVIEIFTEIGSIASSNSAYTAGITRRIQKTGKTIGELTLDEILEIHRKYKKEINELYK